MQTSRHISIRPGSEKNDVHVMRFSIAHLSEQEKPELNRAIDAFIETKPADASARLLVVDLQGVTPDSSAQGVFIDANRRLKNRGDNLLLAGVNPHLSDAMDRMRLNRVMHYTSRPVNEAVTEYRAGQAQQGRP